MLVRSLFLGCQPVGCLGVEGAVFMGMLGSWVVTINLGGAPS